MSKYGTGGPQGQDGRAHIAYFDKRHQASFIYDGTRGSLIDVAIGGYGEPVVALIEAQEFSEDTPIGLVLEAFETRCRRFITQMFAYDLGEDEA